MPWPAFTFFTIARARTSPPGTSKTSFTSVPAGAGSGVAINNPPSPNVATRDTERPPLCCQAISMPLHSTTRGNLRFTLLVSWPKMSPLPALRRLAIFCGPWGMTWNCPHGQAFSARKPATKNAYANSKFEETCVQVDSPLCPNEWDLESIPRQQHGASSPIASAPLWERASVRYSGRRNYFLEENAEEHVHSYFLVPVAT
jgi:hypothetical protein